MHAQLIYSPDYDISFWGLNRFHAFDGWKFSKAWKIITAEWRDQLQDIWLNPTTAVTDEQLLAVHTRDYLDSLQRSATISQIIEIGITRYLPNSLLQKKLLQPLKMASAGTLLAAETALLNTSIAMNLGGGYHHTYPDHGDGFCFFGDAALAIMQCRQKKLLGPADKILMIDLDAHRGNGFYAFMGQDPAVQIFDMYNYQTYPGPFEGDASRHPYLIPIPAGIRDEAYLDILHTRLPAFLNANQDARLAFYNAGNDIFENDRLGKLAVSYNGVLRRDQMVLDALAKKNLPTAIMTSGGYSSTSHRFIAELAKKVIKESLNK